MFCDNELFLDNRILVLNFRHYRILLGKVLSIIAWQMYW